MPLTAFSVRDGAPLILALTGQPDNAGVIRLANTLSRRYGNDVRVVTVLEPLPAYLVGIEPNPAGLIARRVADAERRVSDRVRAVLGREAEWPVTVMTGGVARTVAAAADEWGAAMVVIGIGRHQVLDRLFGSETSVNIVAHSSVPVIAVPEWVTTLPTIAVVGTDFGGCSLAAARSAVDCLALPAAMTLVHATPAFEPALLDRDFVARCRDEVPRRFDSMLRELDARPGITVRTLTVAGQPAIEILATVEECSADLVVIGSHGSGIGDARRIGTVASRLLRAARCMVLIAPACGASLPPGRQGERERAALT
jgi:nucleotide-binding universal stress UspA family protein